MDNITLPSTIFSDIAAGESGPRRRSRVGGGARGFSLLELLIVVGIILTIAGNRDSKLPVGDGKGQICAWHCRHEDSLA